MTKQTQFKIITEIKRINSTSRFDDYGSPRLCRELIASGIQCSKNTVAKLMREAGIAARTKPKFRVSTTDSNHEQPIAARYKNLSTRMT